MTPHDAFLQAICESPDDDTPRLMYADWLEERGDVRGTFLHAQHELARLRPCETRRRLLTELVAQLLAEHGTAWRSTLPTLDGVTWSDEFRDGFVEEVTVSTVEAFLHHAPAIFAATPVRRLNVRRANSKDVVRLAASPYLARLRTLDLHGNPIGVEGARALAACESFAAIRELFLYDCALGDAGVCVLLRLPHPERLRELFLAINQLTDVGGEVVADAGLTSLTELDLRDNAIGNRGVEALAASADLSQLVTLWLVNNRIGDAGARALAESRHLGGLRELYLRYNQIGPIGAEALVRSSRLTELEVLDLARNRCPN